MKTIEISSIQMTGTDAQGKYAQAEVDGDWVGVSLAGEDEVVRDLSEIGVGSMVEVGVEARRVVAAEAK